MWVAYPNSPPSGQAVGGGTAPELRRPSQWWKAPPPGTPFRDPHSEQRRPARAHAVGPVLAPHARTDRTWDTRVAEPWPLAPEDGRPGEGQRLTPHTAHNGGSPPPPGDGPPPPPRTQPRQGMQAKGTVLGPNRDTPAPTARGLRTPTARPVGGQAGEGQRLTSDAPHNGGRHPPRGRPSAIPTASNAGPQGRTLWCWCWVPTPAPTAPGTHGSRNPGCPLQRTGGRGRDSARHQTPLTTVAGHPPGDRLPAPPRHAAPAGHAGHGDSAGPPQPHTRAHSTWVADRNSPRSGRAVGGGPAPDLRRPSQWWKAPPPGTPFHHPGGTQPPQGMQAMGTVLGPHTHTPAPTVRGWRTPRTRPVGGQSGERQRLTSDAPHNGGRHLPRGHPSATPTASKAGLQGRTLWGRCWVPTPAPTAPGTHGSRYPGRLLQRTGARGRDSA